MNHHETAENQTVGRKPLMSKTMFKFIEWAQMALVLILVFVVFSAFFMVSVVPSLSMFPTLQVNEMLITQKRTLPTYDDIIVFRPYSEKAAEVCAQMSVGKNDEFVKRVVGLPGDVIEVKGGQLYRNGLVVESEYTAEEFIQYTMPPVTVGDREYFVLGDNRNASGDSHLLGTFSENQIIGVVVFHMKFPWDASHLTN